MWRALPPIASAFSARFWCSPVGVEKRRVRASAKRRAAVFGTCSHWWHVRLAPRCCPGRADTRRSRTVGPRRARRAGRGGRRGADDRRAGRVRAPGASHNRHSGVRAACVGEQGDVVLGRCQQNPGTWSANKTRLSDIRTCGKCAQMLILPGFYCCTDTCPSAIFGEELCLWTTMVLSHLSVLGRWQAGRKVPSARQFSVRRRTRGASRRKEGSAA